MASLKATRLDHLGSFRNGVNFGREQEGVGVPIVKVKDFGSRIVIPDSGLDELDSSAIILSPEVMLELGDILIIRSNGNPDLVGRSMVYCGSARPITFSGFCIRFRPDPGKANPRYLAYCLRSPHVRAHLTRYGEGTGIHNLSQGVLGGVEVMLPSLLDQARIADTLQSLDDKIELNRRTNETLEAMARAIFRSWFVDFDPVRAKADGRPPYGLDPATAALFPDRLGDDGMPAGWTLGRVCDVVDLQRAGVNPADQPDVTHAHFSIPAFDEGQASKREPGSAIKSNKLVVPHGAVLVSKLNPHIPRIWLPDVVDGFPNVCSTEFLVLTPKPGFTREFVYAMCTSEAFKTALLTYVTGTSNSHQRVNVDGLMRAPWLLPPAPITAAFTTQVAPLLKRVLASQSESTTLAAFRDALLPRLLSGEVSSLQETSARA